MIDKVSPVSVEDGRTTRDMVDYEDYEELYFEYLDKLALIIELKGTLRGCIAKTS